MARLSSWLRDRLIIGLVVALSACTAGGDGTPVTRPSAGGSSVTTFPVDGWRVDWLVPDPAVSTRFAVVGASSPRRAGDLGLSAGGQIRAMTLSSALVLGVGWLPGEDQLVVASTPASQVESARAQIDIVDLSGRQLSRLHAVDDEPHLIPGETFAVDPAGTKAVFAARQNDADGQGDLFALDLTSHRVTALTDTAHVDERSPAFLPDGRVVFVGARPLLERGSLDPSSAFIGILDPVQGRVEHIEAPGVFPVTVAVSADGSRVAVLNETDPTHDSLDRSLLIGDLAGGEFREVVRGNIPWMTMSGDGRSLYYWDGHQVQVVALS